MKALTFTWLGHASFLVENSARVLLDPWIEKNPACPWTLEDVPAIDLVCVTHGHNDHLGDAIPICRKSGATLICSPEIAIYADKRGIGYDEGSWPLNIGGAYRSDAVTVTMVHAEHTSDILGEEFDADGTVVAGSGCCGYVLRFADGPVVYYAGDTAIFGDMALIRDLYQPQVALLPIGGKYTMGPMEARHAARLLQPRALIPMHYNTFPDQAVDIDDFRERVAGTMPDTELVVLKPGESYSYENRR